MMYADSLLPQLDSIFATFKASLCSVGSCVTLAGVGFYLHRRGFVEADGKRTLALISQQVTFPLFLFTRILYCNQDWSQEPCPDITKSLEDVWLLLIWPAVVVFSGILVGYLVFKMARLPQDQLKIVLAAVGFGNSTGLPITLLTVVAANFPKTSDFGRIDPTLFLSVYLLLYPVLQWGIGGWLLAPDEEPGEVEEPKKDPKERAEDDHKGVVALPDHTHNESKVSHSIRHNVLNNQDVATLYLSHRRGLVSSDEGMYMSELDLCNLVQQNLGEDQDDITHYDNSSQVQPPPSKEGGGGRVAGETSHLLAAHDTTKTSQSGEFFANRLQSHQQYQVLQMQASNYASTSVESHSVPVVFEKPLLTRQVSRDQILRSVHPTPPDYNVDTIWQALNNILSRCFQPPVVGALLGICFAAVEPIRGIFVDLEHRSSSAPLQWMFDGLYSVGEAAVPINMMILGANLSSASSKGISRPLLGWRTMWVIVFGKMIVVPFVGIGIGWFLQRFVLDIPDDIDGAFYLVLMIVFLTPTANNVMVMVELSGSNAKEGMAQVIALQYLVAPLILSLTMTIAVGVADGWSY